MMRDQSVPLPDRFKAAAECAPYMHPKLVASHATEATDRDFLSWVDEIAVACRSSACCR